MTPEDLRREADAAELMSRLVSFRPDKTWLAAKAAELRHQADKLEARSWSRMTGPAARLSSDAAAARRS